AVKLLASRPLDYALGPPRSIGSRWAQVRIFAGLIAVHAVAGWTAIWCHYDFRYAASPDPGNPAITFRVHTADPVDPRITGFIAWCRRTHSLPQGYLRGI